jgi:hypothetical protein
MTVIEWSRRFPRATQRAGLYSREERVESVQDERAYDILDDAVPAFHKQPFVTVG